MSIIYTGPVVPSVIYHHHMYYFNPQNSANCCFTLPQILSPSLVLPNVSNMVNACVEPYVNTGAPRTTMPTVGNTYSPTSWITGLTNAVKVNPSFVNQIDACVILDRCKLKESSPKSCASSCSASSSSYFASLSSSSNSSCLSPFSASSPPSLSPSILSSPSSSPTNSSLPSSSESNSSEGSLNNFKSEEATNKIISASSTSSENFVQTNQHNSCKHSVTTCIHNNQQLLTTGQTSSLTPSGYAPSLLSGDANTFIPGAYFAPSSGSLSNQATGAISAAPNISMRDYYARFGVYYIPTPWNQS